MDSTAILALATFVIVLGGGVWTFSIFKWPSDPWLIQRKADKELDKKLAQWHKEWEAENDPDE